MTRVRESLPPDNLNTGSLEPGQRPVGDFFGPFFVVRFLPLTNEPGIIEEALGEGGAEQRTLVPSAGPSDTGLATTFELDSRLLPKTAADLKIESNAGSPFKFTLTLTIPYDDGIRILNNRLITFGTLVRVQWGYASWGNNNIESEVHIFRNNFPEADLADDAARIVLSGHDISSDVAMRGQRRKQWLFSQYPNDKSIVEELVARTRLTLDVSKIPPDSTFLTGSNRPEPAPGEEQGVSQVVNDWAFIKRLCRDHSLSFSARGKKFHIYSLYDFSANPDGARYRLLYRSKPTTEFDVPLMTVKGNLNPWVFLPPEGRGLVRFKVDKDTGEAKAEVLDGTTVPGTPTGDTSPGGGFPTTLATDKSDTGEAVITDEGIVITKPSPTPSDIGSLISTPEESHNFEERVEAVAREAIAFAHPKVGVTAPGVVDMWPGILVRLEGASDLFDGPYTVLRATHTLGGNGYDMELELMRHSVKGVAGEKPLGIITDPQVAATNTATPIPGGLAADSPPGGEPSVALPGA